MIVNVLTAIFTIEKTLYKYYEYQVFDKSILLLFFSRWGAIVDILNNYK